MKTQDGANKMDTTKTYHWKIATPANVQKVADIGCDPVGIDHYSNPDDPGPVGNDRPASQVQYVKKGVGTLTPYARGNYLWSWDSGYGRGDMGFMASGTRSSLQASSTAGGHYSFRSHVKSANPMGALTSNMWALMHKAAVMDIAPPQRSVLPALTLNVVQGSATVLGMLGTKISLFDFRTQIPQKEL